MVLVDEADFKGMERTKSIEFNAFFREFGHDLVRACIQHKLWTDMVVIKVVHRNHTASERLFI